MKLRDLLTLLGALCLAIGPVLMHHVNSENFYLAGEILLAVGPVLMGARALMADGTNLTSGANAVQASAPASNPLPGASKALALVGLLCLGLGGCETVTKTLPDGTVIKKTFQDPKSIQALETVGEVTGAAFGQAAAQAAVDAIQQQAAK